MAKQFQVDTVGDLTTGLVAYYQLEDVTEFFIGGGTLDLTNNNSVAFNTGKIGKAADYGAANTNKYLSIANNLGVGNYQADSFSINFWLNITTAPGIGEDQELWYLNNNSKEQADFRYENNGGTKRLYMTLYNGSGAQSNFTANVDLGTAGWHMVTLVKNTTTVTIYVDGSAIGSPVTQTLADASPGRPNLFLIGLDHFDGDIFPLKGLQDLFGIWTRALSAQNITDLYNGGAGQTMVVSAAVSGDSGYNFFM